MEDKCIKCEMCGKCCRNHTIFLLIQDLKAIELFYPQMNIFSAIILFQSPPDMILKFKPIMKFPQIEIVENDELIKGFLGLKFINTDPKNRDYRVCPYLNENLNLCTIHEHNPMICQGYPYVLNHSGQIQWEGERCQNSWGSDCEIPKEIEIHMENFATKLKIHHKWVKIWNDYPLKEKNLNNFRTFVLEII